MEPERFTRLNADASQMGTSQHISFLANVLNVLTTHEPEADAGWHAVRLLAAMWGTAYADRDQPKAALNDVGAWLEKRLRDQPAPTTKELAEEVGWLKRLARYQDRLSGRQARTDVKQRAAQRQFGNALPRPMPVAVRSTPTVAKIPAPAPRPAGGRGAAQLTRQKSDGMLRAVMTDKQVAEARAAKADELLRSLPPEDQARLAPARPSRCSSNGSRSAAYGRSSVSSLRRVDKQHANDRNCPVGFRFSHFPVRSNRDEAARSNIAST